jgi:predicted nucleotidyltransferase
MGGTTDRLQERARRRADWLAAATSRFEADADVAAAWVFGSEGRGEADELSDLDLFVAVVDDRAIDVLAKIEAQFGEFGDVLAVEEVPDRVAENGRAFVVSYPAPVERLTIEWYFLPAGEVMLGSDVRVLVDKVGLPVADPPLATTSMLPGGGPRRAGGPSGRRAARRADRVQERVTWFWMMVPVIAKWLARGWYDRAEPELARITGLVDEASAFLGRQPTERAAPDHGSVRPLSRLRSAVVELAALEGPLAEMGVSIPPTDVAYGWLELAEDLEAERWKPNSPK